MIKLFKNQVREHLQLIQILEKDERFFTDIERAVKTIIKSLKRGNKILLAGNGGSATQALHMSGEFVNQFLLERKALPSIALTADISNITSIGNDRGYDFIFARQIQALGKPQDILIVFTSSDGDSHSGGHSANLYHALKQAKSMKMDTVGFLSAKTKKLLKSIDIPIVVPSAKTPRVQEVHGLIIHLICEEVEKAFVNK